jgi:hypothetical protein
MPAFQAMFAQLNQFLTQERVQELDPDLYREGRSLADALPERAQELTFALNALPQGIHEAIRAVLRSAARRNMPVTLAWAPAYDFKLSVWDVSSTDETHGGITIFLESRYPDDSHPLHGTMSEAATRSRKA